MSAVDAVLGEVLAGGRLAVAGGWAGVWFGLAVLLWFAIRLLVRVARRWPRPRHRAPWFRRRVATAAPVPAQRAEAATVLLPRITDQVDATVVLPRLHHHIPRQRDRRG
ncbi:hypothetical protein BDK92_7336 [Micromonospora pisi]|uniref:Uncharacterized protein n=1 Tax=Micromonospora pisi TaxID=589240 RepID=A0A495JX64_9ACTN|nr:hypothetical protein [Micromonospora pisi]RKR92854.1 hypothetical protein BDK92_7336 [Micromonospora pisi]